MPSVESEFDLSRRRLAAPLADQATSASPAWLWSTDGSRILGANAVGAAVFGAANVSECATRRFDAQHPAAAAIRRLAPTLPSSGQPRLERLRGFGASFGRALTCVCSRIVLPDGRAAVRVITAEPAGPALTLRERVRRLFAETEQTLAVFAADGTAIWTTEAAQKRLDDAPTLFDLGIARIAAEALEAGCASGTTRYGPVTVERLGCDASAVLAVSFDTPPVEEAFNIEAVPAKGEPPPLATKLEAEPQTPPSSPALGAEAATPLRLRISESAAHSEPAERRHPLRFVWQMDTDGRFVLGSDEFTELIGLRTTAAFGRLWSEVAAELKLDPEGRVARAVASHETWSGIVISWPLDGGSEWLPVELSGLPVFDRERNFRGYRGFGVCRDIDRINQLVRARRERPIGFVTPPEASSAQVALSGATPSATIADITAAGSEAAAHSDYAASITPTAANVVPLRHGTPPETKAPNLSLVERIAFRELAQELTARLRGNEAAVAESSAGVTAAGEEAGATPAAAQSVLLDRIPVGVLIYRHDALL